MGEFVRFSPEEVSQFVHKHLPQVEDSVLENIINHKIDGEVFMSLSEEYLREVAPLLGDRLKIKRLINQLLTDVTVRYSCILVSSVTWQDHLGIISLSV